MAKSPKWNMAPEEQRVFRQLAAARKELWSGYLVCSEKVASLEGLSDAFNVVHFVASPTTHRGGRHWSQSD